MALPYISGKYFFEVTNFILDAKKELTGIKKERNLIYSSKGHLKYKSPNVRKVNLELYDHFLHIYSTGSGSSAKKSQRVSLKIQLYKPKSKSVILLNTAYLYLNTQKSGKAETKISFKLETTDFSLEILCFEPSIFGRWLRYLSSYCIKTNFLDEYKIVEKLDKGGFATVYLGEKQKGGKEKVAFKLIDKSRIQTERNYVNFVVLIF